MDQNKVKLTFICLLTLVFSASCFAEGGNVTLPNGGGTQGNMIPAQGSQQVTAANGADCVEVTSTCVNNVFFPYHTPAEVAQNVLSFPSCLTVGSCVPAGPGLAGVCGSADGVAMPAAPANMCVAPGTSSPDPNDGTYEAWTCTDTGGATQCFTAYDGDCGTVTVNTCDLGTLDAPSSTSTATTWDWKCLGYGTGSPAVCTTPKAICGTSHESGVHVSPSTAAQKCQQGTPSAINGPFPYYAWSCNTAMDTDLCTTASGATVNGLCDNTTWLGCTTGTPNDVPDLGSTQEWHCMGSGPGHTDDTTCSAYVPACGVADGTSPPTIPTQDQSVNHLCLDNSSPTVSGSGPWTWTCTGITGAPPKACATAAPSLVFGPASAGCGIDPGLVFKFAPGTPNPSGRDCPTNGMVGWWDKDDVGCWKSLLCGY